MSRDHTHTEAESERVMRDCVARWAPAGADIELLVRTLTESWVIHALERMPPAEGPPAGWVRPLSFPEYAAWWFGQNGVSA